MAIYPAAVFTPVERYLPEQPQNRLLTGHRRLVYHTAWYDKPSMFSYFNTPGNATPHFYIAEDGSVEQYIDTKFESSADLDGDHDIISVESWDNFQIRRWTDDQVESCARLAAWCHKVHDIPLKQLPNSRPGKRGIGWHRLGIPPAKGGAFPEPPGQLLGGVVEGGEIWTEHAGKTCPGDPKIRGIVNDIIPRAIEIANGDDMSKEDVKAINEHTDEGVRRIIEVINKRAAQQRAFLVRRLGALREAVNRNASQDEMQELLDKLEASLEEDDKPGRGGRGDMDGLDFRQPVSDDLDFDT